jgi:peptide deformylase
MIRPILKFGAPELQRPSEPVENFDRKLRDLARDMLETMYAAPGIGLAAPQVGVNLRLLVVDTSAGEEKGNQIILVNPEIPEQEGEQKGEEGCLSIPGFTALVVRPQRIRIAGQDTRGNRFEMEAEDLLARVLCHEVDHLEGILYLDRISFFKRDLIKRKIRKLIRSGDW